MRPPTVLILAGTAEARAVCKTLANRPGINPVASLAGATQDPAPLAIPTRTGGFGGADGLADWLGAHAPAILIDATHPYAARMQANGVSATRRTGTPHLRLLRPAWPTRLHWQYVPDIASAAGALPKAARALITTGRKTIAPFIDRADTTLFLRTIDQAAPLPDHIEPIRARPPFTHDSERALFALLGLTHLVTKDAGGTGTAKLDVAQAMGVTTLVVSRPPAPDCAIARSVDAAVEWLDQTLKDNGP